MCLVWVFNIAHAFIMGPFVLIKLFLHIVFQKPYSIPSLTVVRVRRVVVPPARVLVRRLQLDLLLGGRGVLVVLLLQIIFLGDRFLGFYSVVS